MVLCTITAQIKDNSELKAISPMISYQFSTGRNQLATATIKYNPTNIKVRISARYLNIIDNLIILRRSSDVLIYSMLQLTSSCKNKNMSPKLNTRPPILVRIFLLWIKRSHHYLSLFEISEKPTFATSVS